jgi:hypothetical protein
MGSSQEPAPDHPEFDAICSRVDDFEPLPTVTTVPVPPAQDLDEEERTASLDQLILGGLVSP